MDAVTGFFPEEEEPTHDSQDIDDAEIVETIPTNHNPYNELIPENLLHFALDIISEGLEEIEETTETIKDFPELDEKINALKDIITDCYNVDNLADYYDQEIEKEEIVEVTADVIIE